MKLGKRILGGLNFTLRRTLNSKPLRVPVLGGLKAGIRGELFLLDIFNAFLPRLQGAVVDVGANIGQTLVKVKAADPARRYFGFEPNASCFYYLDRLVRANGWNNVVLIPVGLADRTSLLALHTDADKATDSKGSFRGEIVAEGRQTEPKLAPVFDFSIVDGVIDAPIGLLKIDVEGGELEVLKAMRERIERDAPVIVMEMMPNRSLETRHRETVELLDGCGYLVYRIDRDAERRWAGLQLLNGYSRPSRSDDSEYLAVPRRLAALALELSPDSTPPER